MIFNFHKKNDSVMIFLPFSIALFGRMNENANPTSPISSVEVSKEAKEKNWKMLRDDCLPVVAYGMSSSWYFFVNGSVSSVAVVHDFPVTFFMMMNFVLSGYDSI